MAILFWQNLSSDRKHVNIHKLWKATMVSSLSGFPPVLLHGKQGFEFHQWILFPLFSEISLRLGVGTEIMWWGLLKRNSLFRHHKYMIRFTQQKTYDWEERCADKTPSTSAPRSLNNFLLWEICFVCFTQSLLTQFLQHNFLYKEN